MMTTTTTTTARKQGMHMFLRLEFGDATSCSEVERVCLAALRAAGLDVRDIEADVDGFADDVTRAIQSGERERTMRDYGITARDLDVRPTTGRR